MSSSDTFCKNCGTTLTEMGVSAKDYDNSSPDSFGQVIQPAELKGNKEQMKKFQAMVLTLVLIVLIAVAGIYFIRQNFSRRVDCGDFTIKLPFTCEADYGMNSLTDGLSYGENSGGYGSNDISFTYIAYDISELSEFNIDSEDLKSYYITYMTSSMSENDGFESISTDDDSMTFYYTDNTDSYYSQLSCDVHGDKLYMYIFMCDRSDRSKYENDFKEYLDSIVYE
jgi:hypothetical protein